MGTLTNPFSWRRRDAPWACSIIKNG